MIKMWKNIDTVGKVAIVCMTVVILAAVYTIATSYRPSPTSFGPVGCATRLTHDACNGL